MKDSNIDTAARRVIGYNEANELLLDVFQKNDALKIHESWLEIESSIKKDKKKERKKLLKCYTLKYTNFDIIIEYPGTKIKQTDEKIYFDYKVILKNPFVNQALSHEHIIIDLCNKCHNNVSSDDLKTMIIGLFTNGLNLKLARKFSNYKCNKVSEDLVTAFQNSVKGFKPLPDNYELSFDELITNMFWISLEEDFNYPMSEGKDGRKMSISRYIEALHCYTITTHSIPEVLWRDKSSKSPSQWKDLDYSFLKEIK